MANPSITLDHVLKQRLDVSIILFGIRFNYDWHHEAAASLPVHAPVPNNPTCHS
jgi:hypothetical protein